MSSSGNVTIDLDLQTDTSNTNNFLLGILNDNAEYIAYNYSYEDIELTSEISLPGTYYAVLKAETYNNDQDYKISVSTDNNSNVNQEDDLIFDNSEIIFTSSNWDQPQSITINTPNNDTYDGDQVMFGLI